MTTVLNRFIILSLVFGVAAGCSTPAPTRSNNGSAPNTAVSPQTVVTPSERAPSNTASNKFTAADVEKLKWIEGTWKGTDGSKLFYERYRFEDTAMIVESLKEDGTPAGKPERFELRNGEFGKGDGDQRSAASEITEAHAQFVPAGKSGNKFRFVKRPYGWDAVHNWPAVGGNLAQQKVHKMEPWQPKK